MGMIALASLASCSGQPDPPPQAAPPAAAAPLAQTPAAGSVPAAARPGTPPPSAAEMDRFRQSVQTGVDFLNAGRFKEAAGELSIAAGIQPENVQVLMFLSSAQARSGEFQRAQRVLKQAVELDPNNPAPHYELAQVSISLGNFAQAKSASQIALDLDPQNRKAQELVAQVKVRTGDSEGALATLESAVAAGPARPDTEFVLGLCYMSLERNEEARDILQKVVQQNPRYVPAWWRLSEALTTLGDVDGAAAARKTFQDLGGTPPPQEGGS